MKRGPKIKNTCNDNYFSVPTLENSYWAGFIAADGHLEKRKNINSKRLLISISNKDKQNLELFLKHINYNGNILDIPRNRARVNITSSQIVDDLHNIFNIKIGNKTYDLKPPILSDELTLAYLKGFIDGDGWISLRTKYKYLTLGFCGATKDFLIWIKSIIDRKFPYKKLSNVFSVENDTFFIYTIEGHRTRWILTELNKIKTPQFNRKWDKLWK